MPIKTDRQNERAQEMNIFYEGKIRPISRRQPVDLNDLVRCGVFFPLDSLQLLDLLGGQYLFF
jgi:hypothetical protein